MDSDDDSDTHLCLKCHQTVVGLDNYVTHRRSECPSLLTSLAKKNKATNVTELAVDTPVSVPSRQEDDPTSRPPENAFFLSLELQSASRPQLNESSLFEDDVVRPSVADVGLLPYAPQDAAVLDTADAFDVEPDHIYGATDADDNVPDSTDEDPDVDDRHHPPRTHTGGKWRPAAFGNTSPPRPAPSPTFSKHCYNTRRRPTKCPRCFNVHSGFSRHCTAQVNPTVNHKVCNACDGLFFLSTSALVEHLASPACRGWQHGRDDPSHVRLVLKHSDLLAPLAPFRCELCHFYFNLPEEFLRHWSTSQPSHDDCVTSGQIISCSHCTGAFREPRQLHQHLATLLASLDHRGRARLTPLVTGVKRGRQRCTICQTECSSARGLAIHMGRVHKTGSTLKSEPELDTTSSEDEETPQRRPTRRWRCRECSRVCDCRQALLHHVTLFHPDSVFECRDCCRSYLRRTNLESHCRTLLHRCYKMSIRSSAVEDPPEKLSCGLCNFVTASASGLAFHRIMDHSEERDPRKGEVDDGASYFCTECSDGPLQIQQLRLHLTAHSGETPALVCLSCSIIFDSEEDLRAHDRSQHKSKNLLCELCDYRTHRNNKLAIHLEQHNSDRKRSFLCHTCAASFYSSSVLRNHMNKHYKQRSHRCSVKECTRAFRTAIELTEHGRTHAPEKPFLCDTCGYSTKTRSQLAKHRRRHSTGVKRFRCTHPGCSFAANLSASLRRHNLVHSGAKPYQCRHCKYTCNTQENLRKHVLKSKIHAGLNVYPCPHCAFGCDFVAEMQRHLAEEHGVTGDDDDPSFVSRATGVYRRGEADSEPLKVVPIRYVPPKKVDTETAFEKDCESHHDESCHATADHDGNQPTSFEASLLDGAEFYHFEAEEHQREEIVFTLAGPDDEHRQVEEISVDRKLLLEETNVDGVK